LLTRQSSVPKSPHVAGRELRAPAERLDGRQRVLGGRVALQVDDGDVETAPGQGLGDRRADAAPAARHQGDGIACGVRHLFLRSPLARGRPVGRERRAGTLPKPAGPRNRRGAFVAMRQATG
jgi:hypothetical protein